MAENFATNETAELIASNKVDGTAVYNAAGDRLGSIYNFMVDKRSGKVAYVVLSFGGFLGIGNDYYPLPWKKLTYDVNHDGYVVDLSKEALEGAPRYSNAEEQVFDRNYGESVYGFYGLRYDY